MRFFSGKRVLVIGSGYALAAARQKEATCPT